MRQFIQFGGPDTFAARLVSALFALMFTATSFATITTPAFAPLAA